MNLEASTINLLLGAIITLQAWIIKELFQLKTRLAIILEHCPQCGKLRKKDPVPEILLILFILSSPLTAWSDTPATVTGKVTLAWNFYPGDNVDAFVLYTHTNLTDSPTGGQWTRLATIPARTNGAAVTNWSVAIEPSAGSRFYFMTASNFWGESAPSNTAGIISPPLQPPLTIKRTTP